MLMYNGWPRVRDSELNSKKFNRLYPYIDKIKKDVTAASKTVMQSQEHLSRPANQTMKNGLSTQSRET